jgi:hypothetical protein
MRRFIMLHRNRNIPVEVEVLVDWEAVDCALQQR